MFFGQSTMSVDLFYSLFKKDVDTCKTDLDVMEEQKKNIENEIRVLSTQRIPDEHAFKLVRMHVIFVLAKDPDMAIGDVERTIEKEMAFNKTNGNGEVAACHTWLLLWCIHKYIGNEDKCTKLENKIAVPVFNGY